MQNSKRRRVSPSHFERLIVQHNNKYSNYYNPNSTLFIERTMPRLTKRAKKKAKQEVFEPQAHNFQTNGNIRCKHQLQPIRWGPNTNMPSGQVVTENAHEVLMDEETASSLLQYLEHEGIVDEARHLTAGGEPLAVGEEKTVSFGESTFTLQRHKRCSNSNMHWMTPADYQTNNKVLQILGDAGFDETLEAIGSSLGLDGLVVLEINIIFVSSCDEGDIHVDSRDTDDRATTAIIPLVLPPNLTPELKIFDGDVNSNVGGYKYTRDVALLLGDEVSHATSKVEHTQGHFRMMATLFMADVTPQNVDAVKKSYSQDGFRPDPLTIAGTHWKKDDKSVKLPRSQE